MIDIDEIREAHKKFHGLSKADAVYTFYHDETNNIIKLRLNEQGLNIAEPNVFVLGGIVHDGLPCSLDIQPLRKSLQIQQSAHEIKLKHIAKGDFLDLLKSDKLTTFLQWVSDSGMFIHYHALDPIYWSLIDIMDSILHELDEPLLMELHNTLKADLVTLLRTNLSATTSLLFRYNYPNLAPESRKLFLNELLEMLEHSDGVLPEFNMMMLKGMLQAGRNLPSLDFIEGLTPHILIENFSAFYLTRIAVFKYSSHILDMENSIQGEIKEMNPASNGVPVTHYRFADSKSENGIQIADIVVGLIGKMYSYFTYTSRDKIAQTRSLLEGVSLKNVELLRDLIDASHEKNITFLNHVLSASDIHKMNLFLRNSGTAYEE